jgi:hypothetical protein
VGVIDSTKERLLTLPHPPLEDHQAGFAFCPIVLKNSLSAMLDFWEAYERGIQKISWGTSQFVDWAACGVLNRSKMVLSGDVPSNCSLASFRHARFFDFFNEIRR